MSGPRPYRHREKGCLLIVLALVLLVDVTVTISGASEGYGTSDNDVQAYGPDISSSRTLRSETEASLASPCLNEVYPDPERDLNGDSSIDQMDEFIEIFNPAPSPVDLYGHSISDNQGTFLIGHVTVGPGGFALFYRNISSLILSNDDIVTLRGPNGTVIDVLDYPAILKGWAYQRSPDGSGRVRKGHHPTPAGPNPVPSLVLNEVMPDPVGQNDGRQWVEVLNSGPPEDLRDMLLTNNEAVVVALPSLIMDRNERVLLAFGGSVALPPHPEGIRTVLSTNSGTLYSTGDDLELMDRDGTSLDYLAWGGSKHVGGPRGAPKGTCWDGKYWDETIGMMSVEGSPNPEVVQNRSISRHADGYDSNRTVDLAPHVGDLGSSPGWDNGKDPSIRIGPAIVTLDVEKGGSRFLTIELSASCNMSGNVNISLTISNKNWALSPSVPSVIRLNGSEASIVEVMVSAPTDLTLGHSCIMDIKAFWESWEFHISSLRIELVIPSPELFLMELFCSFEGVGATIVPEGAVIDVGGKLCSGGEVTSPDAVLELSAFNASLGPSDPSASRQAISFMDLKLTSKRSFGLTIDTKGFLGMMDIRLLIDPGDLIEESNESNNAFIWRVSVVPAPPFQGQGALRLTEVLWNTTPNGRYVRITNTGSDPAELSGFKLGSDGCMASFALECWLGPFEEAYILWGPESLGRVPTGTRVFRLDSNGPISDRMSVPKGPPDLSVLGRIGLFTRWKVPVDEVILNPGGGTLDGCLVLGNGPVETTYGTPLCRIKGRDGVYIDTNSTLDWVVAPIRARIGAIMISPGQSGSGEFVAIKALDKIADLSGSCLLCSGRMAVIPNGTTTGADGWLIVSNDPEGFLGIQATYPDLTTSLGATMSDIMVPGCRVPGYDELVLPNDGGELLLLDGGNRAIDRVVWGSESGGQIMDAPYDTVLWRQSPYDLEEGHWSVMTSGSKPAFSLLGLDGIWSSLSVLGPKDGLMGLDEGDQDIELYAPYIQKGPVLDLALGLLEVGEKVNINLGCHPWDVQALSFYQGAEQGPVLAGCKALVARGASVLAPVGNTPLAPFVPFLVKGNRTLMLNGHLSYAAPGIAQDLPTISIMPEEGSLALPRLEHTIPDEGMVDITSVLSSMPSSGGGISTDTYFGRTDGGPHFTEKVNISVKSSLDMLQGSQGEILWTVHNGGLLDAMSLLDRARCGVRVRSMVSPRSVAPSEPHIPYEGMGDITVLSHRLDFQDLERSVLDDCIRASRIAIEEGLDLEVRLLPVESGFIRWSGIEVCSNTVQLGMPSSDGSDCAAFRFITGRPEFWEGLVSSLWSECTPLPMDIGWDAPYRTILGNLGPIRIMEVYPDTYLVDDPDEYVALENTGDSSVDVSFWTISDDEGRALSSDGTIMLPEGTIIAPGRPFFIARDHRCFLDQNGCGPDLAMGNCSISDLVLICSGDMRLSNKGDSVIIRDASGAIIDSVLYGDIDPLPQCGTFAPSGGWTGTPAPLPGWGNILHRETTGTSGSEPDTNSRNDWMGVRPRSPGQSRFGPFPECEVTDCSIGICPDSGSDLIWSLIANTTRTLDVNVYELTSPWITATLAGIVERGVRVRVILEGSPVGGRTYTSIACATELLAAGVEVRFMMTDVSKGLRDRYTFDHAKYMISDRNTVMISSDNLKDTSFPPILVQGSCSGTRGWAVLLESAQLADQLGGVFEDDWGGPDMLDAQDEIGEVGRSEPVSIASEIVLGEGLYIFRSKDILPKATATLLVAPDHLSLERNPLIEAIGNAKEEVLVEALAMDIEFLLPGTNHSSVRKGTGLDFPGVFHPNPYVNALILAASRGVDVKILLDGSDFNGDSVPDNQGVATEMMMACRSLGALGHFSVQLHPNDRTDGTRKVTFVHNKGMIIDSQLVWTSSFNFGPTSALTNREVGVLMGSREAATRFREAFMFDWGGTLPGGEIVRSVRYRPSEMGGQRGVKVEIELYPEKLPDSGFELVLAPSSLWDLSGPPNEGAVMGPIAFGSGPVVTMVVPDLEDVGGAELDLYLRSGDRWDHLMRFGTVIFEEDGAPQRVEWYRWQAVPLVGTVGLALLFTTVVDLFKWKLGRSRNLSKSHLPGGRGVQNPSAGSP